MKKIQTYNYRYLKKKVDILIMNLNKNAKRHPLIVTIVMHELFRSLYPYDPFINKKLSKNHSLKLKKILHDLISFVKSLDVLGYYSNYQRDKFITLKKKVNTQELFGSLWKERKEQKFLDSRKTLFGLLKRNNIDLNYFKKKNILDMGCGSGRFTLAFSYLNPEKVIGVDLGEEGLKIAKSIAKKKKIKNVKFIKSSVLNLPFRKNTFDFVFCKGVLHHTGNTFKGLDNIKKVLKKGGKAFVYLYGSGGIFWYTRKQMRKVMRKIPYDFAIQTLNLLGMPSKRTIFVDSWYVPIEDHINKKKLENCFKSKGFSFQKYSNAIKTELEYMEKKDKFFTDLYGSGELRYIIKKL
tara:strand:+ start:75 stop:1127 length:1053 start_codon:yes stop_codon:yes gene_type:complete